MADTLPEPASRKEEFLAKAAGMSGIELPTPASREELYLNAIAEGGGGGGGGGTGKEQITILTEDDYSEHSGLLAVDLWLLDDGIYYAPAGIFVRTSMARRFDGDNSLFLIKKDSTFVRITEIGGAFSSAANDFYYGGLQSHTAYNHPSRPDGDEIYVFDMLTNSSIVNGLDSTATNRPLGASQGNVLKRLIDSLVVKNEGAPTTATVGTVGMLLEDTTNGKLYICTAISGNTYTWSEVGAGGGGATVRTLTTSDYNYPTNNPTSVGLWLLEPGLYVRENTSVVVRATSTGGTSQINMATMYLVDPESSFGNKRITTFGSGSLNNEDQSIVSYDITVSDGTSQNTVTYVNNTTYGAEKILYKSSAPTSSSAGHLGQIWVDISTTPTTTYQCTARNDNYYVWTQFGGGGGPIQTLTSADLNWNRNLQSATTPYDSIALWLLPSGLYYIDNPDGDFTAISNIDGRADFNDPSEDGTIVSIVSTQEANTLVSVVSYPPSNEIVALEQINVDYSTGEGVNGAYDNSVYYTPKYGNSGEYAIVKKVADDPNNDGIVGFVGDLCIDTSNFGLYVCDSRDDTDPSAPVCTWTLLSGNSPV